MYEIGWWSFVFLSQIKLVKLNIYTGETSSHSKIGCCLFRFRNPYLISWDSIVAHLVKNPPAMRETWVRKIPWRRERLPTPVFWPGEFHELYSPWDCKELDMTEQLSLSLFTAHSWVLRNFIWVFAPSLYIHCLSAELLAFYACLLWPPSWTSFIFNPLPLPMTFFS